MNRDALKIFIACAIGAAVGTVVALDVSKYFWWLGLLAGGATGYFSYEWRAVIRALPAAYRAAGQCECFSKRYLRSVLGFWTWGVATIVSLLAWVALADRLMAPLIPINRYWAMAAIVPCAVVLIVGLVCALFAALAMLVIQLTDEPNPKWSRVLEHESTFREFAYIISPPTVIFWHVPRTIAFLICGSPKAFRRTKNVLGNIFGMIPGELKAASSWMKRFGWELFVRIHSERRLICGVDALLGSAVGYFAGSAAIGALAGGILGVINYAVVTEHWLRPRGYIRAR